MPQIYLNPPHGVTIYGKLYCEGVYGELDFTPDQMKSLIDVGVAAWFDLTSPHTESHEVANSLPDGEGFPISVILARAEYWKLPWESDEHRKRYFALRKIFALDENRSGGFHLLPARSNRERPNP